MIRLKTKILVDGGDPQETRRVKELLGFVDGQTTNPSLIAKNPHIQELIASGHKLSNQEEMEEYKPIVQTISLLVGDAGVFTFSSAKNHRGQARTGLLPDTPKEAQESQNAQAASAVDYPLLSAHCLALVLTKA